MNLEQVQLVSQGMTVYMYDDDLSYYCYYFIFLPLSPSAPGSPGWPGGPGAQDKHGSPFSPDKQMIPTYC